MMRPYMKKTDPPEGDKSRHDEAVHEGESYQVSGRSLQGVSQQRHAPVEPEQVQHFQGRQEAAEAEEDAEQLVPHGQCLEVVELA